MSFWTNVLAETEVLRDGCLGTDMLLLFRGVNRFGDFQHPVYVSIHIRDKNGI